jgi:hypothetical protein
MTEKDNSWLQEDNSGRKTTRRDVSGWAVRQFLAQSSVLSTHYFSIDPDDPEPLNLEPEIIFSVG